MFDQIARAMGKTVDDREVQELLKALGSAPGKPAKPNSDGYVFAGFFVAWCIDNNLLHPDLVARARDAVKAVKARKMTGREFIVGQIDHRAWDGKHNHVWSCDLSPVQREFFWCYLCGVLSKGIWGKDDTGYYEDFLGRFRKRFPKLKAHPPPWSVVPDTWEHCDEMAKVIADRHATWQKKSKERRKQFLSQMSRG